MTTRTLPSSVLLAFLLLMATQQCEAGEIGRFVKNVGKATGIKPIEEAGKELERGWDKAKEKAPIIQDIQHVTSDQVRDAGRWARENPEEAIAIVAVVAVGWAACVDGCTLVAGLVLDGASAGGIAATIPIASIELADEDDNEIQVRPIPAGPSSAKNDGAEFSGSQATAADESKEHAKVQVGGIDATPVAKGDSQNERTSDYIEMGLQAQYPKYISLADDIDSKKVIVYRSLNERISEALNHFAPPVYPALVRLPNGNDIAGGTFLSKRSNIGNSEEALAAKEGLGSTARRVHGAIDFHTTPGQPVFAPMSGTIDKAQPWLTTSNGFKGIRIVTSDGTLARVLYLEPDPALKAGDEVEAGKTKLGISVDIRTAYPGTPNHVHIDFSDYLGRRFDPWTNSVLDPLP